MVKKESKKPYDGVAVEIILYEKNDIIITSDLFGENGNPGGSTSDGSWT